MNDETEMLIELRTEIFIVHRIEMDRDMDKLIDELEMLAVGATLEDIAEGAISASLDEQIIEVELDDEGDTAQHNKEAYLEYSERRFWAEHVDNETLETVTELTCKLYDIFHMQGPIIYTLLKQAVQGLVSIPDEIYTIETVTCKLLGEHMDVTIEISGEKT